MYFIQVEESLRRRNKGKTFSDGVYEFSNSTRRSFLRKIKGNEASNSSGSLEGECRELAVYSDVDSLVTRDNARHHTELSSSYCRVEKRNFNCVR